MIAGCGGLLTAWHYTTWSSSSTGSTPAPCRSLSIWRRCTYAAQNRTTPWQRYKPVSAAQWGRAVATTRFPNNLRSPMRFTFLEAARHARGPRRQGGPPSWSRMSLCGCRRSSACFTFPESSGKVTRADGALGLQGVLTFPDRLTLVPLALTAGQSDLDLGATAQEIHLQRHDGVALLAGLPRQFVDLLAMQEKFPPPARGVVGPRALGVLRDVHPF